MINNNLNKLNMSIEDSIIQKVGDYTVVNENGFIHIFDEDEVDFLLVESIDEELNLPNSFFTQSFLIEKSNGNIEENEDYLIANQSLQKVLRRMLNRDTEEIRPYLVERSTALMIIATNDTKGDTKHHTKYSSKAKKFLKNSYKIALKIVKGYNEYGATGALDIIKSSINDMDNIISSPKRYKTILKALKKINTPLANDIRGSIKSKKGISDNRGTVLSATENLEFFELKKEKLAGQLEELSELFRPSLE